MSTRDSLDSATILESLEGSSQALLKGLTVFTETDSTNAALQRLAPEVQHGQVILADCQSAGRGRRQRSWHSPSGCNVYLSLGWQFGVETGQLSTLSLCVAVAVCRALTSAGLRGHGVKWPNDIQLDGAKLGGILIQVQTTTINKLNAVIGVGVNVSMSSGDFTVKDIDQPWTDIVSNLDSGLTRPTRNQVAVCLIDELLRCVLQFQQEGFRAFSGEWNKLDALNGRKVSVLQNGSTTTGISCGVSRDGGLLLERVDSGGRVLMQEFHAGEVSVRKA